MRFLQRITRNRYLCIADMLLVGFAYVLTLFIINPVRSAGAHVLANGWFILGAIVVFVGFFYLFGCYRVYWLYGSTKEYLRMLVACFFASIVMDVACQIHPMEGFYLKGDILATMLASVFTISLRMGVRVLGKFMRMSICHSTRQNPKNVLIVGAGDLGVTLARDITKNMDLNYHVLGFIDDDENKKNMSICGCKVLGTVGELRKIYEWLRPDEVIIAISTISLADKQRIIRACGELSCKIKILPGIADSLYGKSTDFIREVEAEDLLERKPVRLDSKAIEKEIKDKVIMVTGGGGSIGSELCRQIAPFAPSKLVILDIYENNAFDLENDLHDRFPDCNVEVVIASVRDKERLNQVFAQYKPSMVFHAAAHKHVPMMENNAMEAVKNNVFGTYNVARCADAHGCESMVLISTDKAVNPTNVMGATKRICEMIVQAMQTVSNTEFVAVRFGNVLNSNGSVLPRFKQQLARGGPVTVTHPEITRFFMTIPEAAQLVLQAGAFARGGEIFVLDMGQPVKIYDLAKNLIRLSGLKEDVDIKIEFTGLRAGEKLYEELLMEEEGLEKTAHDKIYIGKPFFNSMDLLQQNLNILEEAVLSQDNETVKEAVEKVVPTYQRKKATEATETESSLQGNGELIKGAGAQ